MEKEILDREIEIEQTKRKVVKADALKGTLTTFSELYAEATSEEQKELLKLHINKVIWTPQEISLALFTRPTEDPGLLTNSRNVQSVVQDGSPYSQLTETVGGMG